MKRILYILVATFLLQNLLFAKPTFPELTGRVVDNAKILNESEKQTLSKILEKHEKETSNQIVVVTLSSLDGYDIADYGYQLGRFWGIGQKNKNNGVLLIVSMEEKKIRIEVGYGLEGALTDARAHEIIEYIIKPKFRLGTFYKGILEGTNSIIDSIKGEYTKENYNVPSDNVFGWFILYFLLIFVSPILAMFFKNMQLKSAAKVFHSTMLGGFAGAFTIAFFGSFILSLVAFIILTTIVYKSTKKLNYNSGSSNHSYGNSYTGFGGGFGSSSGGFGGGFSGGGGSFGGGGASGGW